MNNCENCGEPIEPGTGVVPFDFFSDEQPRVHRACVKQHWQAKEQAEEVRAGAAILGPAGYRLEKPAS